VRVESKELLLQGAEAEDAGLSCSGRRVPHDILSVMLPRAAPVGALERLSIWTPAWAMCFRG
jgi:hypothetical protein